MPDPAGFEHLKMCSCPVLGPQFAYACARCNRTYCSTCDHVTDADEVKTIVRYCPDWRCQRERKIEEGALLVVSRPLPCDCESGIMRGHKFNCPNRR